MITRERIEEIFEDHDSDWTGDNAFQGLTILSKYIDATKHDLIGCAEHDIIYGPAIDDLIKAGITEEDVEALASLNWHVDEGSFCCFV